MKSREDIYNALVDVLHEMFEIPKDRLKPEANLYTDLDIDSIDAVDMAVRLQQFIDKRISPEEFKQIRTVEDVINAIYDLI